MQIRGALFRQLLLTLNPVNYVIDGILNQVFSTMSTASTAIASATDSPESFAALFEESLSRQEMRVGEVITAQVVRVDYNVVVVNAGLKSESFIPVEEFKNDKGEIEVKPGDFVSVAIEALEDGLW